MKDRIQIDGTWYVREDIAESSSAGAKDKEEDLYKEVSENIDTIKTIRYIDEGISFEAEYSEDNEFWGVTITKFVGIKEERICFWDSEYFLWHLATGNEESIETATKDLEEPILKKLIIFLKILIEKNLITN